MLSEVLERPSTIKEGNIQAQISCDKFKFLISKSKIQIFFSIWSTPTQVFCHLSCSRKKIAGDPNSAKPRYKLGDRHVRSIPKGLENDRLRKIIELFWL